MQWPAAVLADLKAFHLLHPFGPEGNQLEWAFTRATIKNAMAPRKGRPFTADELKIAYRRPPTDDELNLQIRALFGWPGSPSQNS